MNWSKRLLATGFVRDLIGFSGANYLRLVHATSRFACEPRDPYGDSRFDMPVIVATWHGQHLMASFARRKRDRVASLVSRSRDGDLNAAILKHLDVRTIRGSGARGRDQRQKGGAEALRHMLRALAGGESIVMTADVPKVSRVCGLGIVTLAQLSGRPIVPVAVVSSRRIDFGSWDRASVGLPFGRGAMVFGAPIWVERSRDAERLERRRREVEVSLDAVYGRAYAMVGDSDPGARRTDLHSAA